MFSPLSFYCAVRANLMEYAKADSLPLTHVSEYCNPANLKKTTQRDTDTFMVMLNGHERPLKNKNGACL